VWHRGSIEASLCLTCAQQLGVTGALYWAASQLDLPTLADSGYERAGQGIHTPHKQPAAGRRLAADNRTYNANLRSMRCLGERGLALSRCRSVDTAPSLVRGTGQIARASGECGGHPRGGWVIGGEFVVSAADVLHEGMPGDDCLGGAVGAEPAYWSESVLERAMVGVDRVVGVPFDVVPSRWDQLIEHAGGETGVASVRTSPGVSFNVRIAC
jgi:hypothetical protein